MDVIILAGGYAERLWPLTEEYPKVLLKIGGKEILFHLLCNIQDIPTITSITIAIDETKLDYFENFLKKIKLHNHPTIKLSVHPLENGKIIGPISKLDHILQESPKNNFLVIGGDNFFGFSLKELTDFFQENKRSTIAIKEEEKIYDSSQFGIPEIGTDNTISKFWEKKEIKQVSFISTACYIFDKNIRYQIKDYLKHLNEEEGLGSFISWLTERGEKLLAFKFKKPWFDAGTRDGLLGANRVSLTNLSSIYSTGLLRGTNKIRPPVFIEDNAIIKNSEIGPYVYIDHKVIINNSKISNSIVYKNSQVTNSKLLNSIVGSQSIIEGDVGEAVLGPNTKIIRDNK